MVLDKAYDANLDEVGLEEDTAWLDRVPPELEWDESEILLAVQSLIGGSRMPSNT